MRKFTYGILAGIYFLLGIGMYYFNTEGISLGINILYKIILAGVIVILSFAVFLIHTDLNRASILLKYVCLLILPQLSILVISMPLWVFRMQAGTYIRRGAFDQFYGITVTLAMAGMIYVFGKRGFWLNFAAMLGANLVTIAEVIWKNGFRAYWEELKTVIVTFAGDTGELMQAVEIHELTFAIGVCLLFCILNRREVRKFRLWWVLLLVAVFCFLSGFKRIGALAMGTAFLSGQILEMLTHGKQERKFWPLLLSCLIVLAMFAYICLVKGGVYEFLSDHFNLDTMGRRELSRYIDDYYWVGPDYLGNGAGFVSRMFSDLPQEYTIRALHNDILAIYIDNGFWGFWIWMLLYMPLRTWVLCKWQGIRGGILSVSLGLFILITAMTDNTIYYVYVTSAVAISAMSYRIEELEG